MHKLLEVLERLRDEGNTVIVIEHNLDMIKRADYVVDMGPGRHQWRSIGVSGTPEQVAACEASYTGQYLKELLKTIWKPSWLSLCSVCSDALCSRSWVALNSRRRG